MSSSRLKQTLSNSPLSPVPPRRFSFSSPQPLKDAFDAETSSVDVSEHSSVSGDTEHMKSSSSLVRNRRFTLVGGDVQNVSQGEAGEESPGGNGRTRRKSFLDDYEVQDKDIRRLLKVDKALSQSWNDKNEEHQPPRCVQYGFCTRCHAVRELVCTIHCRACDATPHDALGVEMEGPSSYMEGGDRGQSGVLASRVVQGLNPHELERCNARCFSISCKGKAASLKYSYACPTCREDSPRDLKPITRIYMSRNISCGVCKRGPPLSMYRFPACQHLVCMSCFKEYLLKHWTSLAGVAKSKSNPLKHTTRDAPLHGSGKTNGPSRISLGPHEIPTLPKCPHGCHGSDVIEPSVYDLLKEYPDLSAWARTFTAAMQHAVATEYRLLHSQGPVDHPCLNVAVFRMMIEGRPQVLCPQRECGRRRTREDFLPPSFLQPFDVKKYQGIFDELVEHESFWRTANLMGHWEQFQLPRAT